jgi:hypothetical protein
MDIIIRNATLRDRKGIRPTSCSRRTRSLRFSLRSPEKGRCEIDAAAINRLILSPGKAILDCPMSHERAEIVLRVDDFQCFDNLVAQLCKFYPDAAVF